MSEASLQGCRASVEAWHRSWAAGRLAAWRDGGEEPPPPWPVSCELASASGWTDESSGPFYEGALRARLGRDRLRAASWPLERVLAAWWAEGGRAGGWLAQAASVSMGGVQEVAWRREVETALERHASASWWLAVRRKAVRLWSGLVATGEVSHPDAGGDPEALSESARRFLDETEEAVAVWGRRSVGCAPSLAAVVRAASDPSDEEVWGRASARWERAASPWRALGFGSRLEERVRVAPPHRGASPAALVARRVPSDLWVSMASWARGLVAERAAWRAVAEALVVAGVDPALPVELRRSWPASVRGAVGMLAAGWTKDRRFLDRLGLGGASRERVAQRAAWLELLELRLAAAASVSPPRLSSDEERLAWGAEQASEALGFSVGPMLAMACLPQAPVARRRWRLGRATLALQWRLRERFDEDWWRNPRFAEPLRAAAHPGGLLSVERWLEELGGTFDADASAWVRACWGGS